MPYHGHILGYGMAPALYRKGVSGYFIDGLSYYNHAMPYGNAPLRYVNGAMRYGDGQMRCRKGVGVYRCGWLRYIHAPAGNANGAPAYIFSLMWYIVGRLWYSIGWLLYGKGLLPYGNRQLWYGICPWRYHDG